MTIVGLPAYRHTGELELFGDRARFRFRQLSVWVLSTDPFILGLPAGEPIRTWREFAVAETGIRNAEHASPVAPLIVRFVVRRELDHPLARLVIFPADFWDKDRAGDASVRLSLVTLWNPMSIDEALNALAAGEHPSRLGTVETVALHERFPSENQHTRSLIADRERLLAQ